MNNRIFILFASIVTLTASSCQKPSDLSAQSQGLMFFNQTDKPITVSVYDSYSKYITGRGTNTFTVNAGSSHIPKFANKLLYIDWFTHDTALSNWGRLIDTTIATEEVNNALAFPNTLTTIKKYNITDENATARIIYLGKGTKSVWNCVEGIDNSGKQVEKTKNLLQSTLSISKNYNAGITIKSRGNNTVSLFTKQYNITATSFTDSAGKAYTATIIPGPSHALDTLLIKLPFSDTTYKFVKK